VSGGPCDLGSVNNQILGSDTGIGHFTRFWPQSWRVNAQNRFAKQFAKIFFGKFYEVKVLLMGGFCTLNLLPRF